jgi:ribosomal protein S18 acetylase RimI-like enzyme
MSKVSNAASLIKLYHTIEDYFFRAISTECLDFGDDATAYMTGVDSGNLNPVSLRRHTRSLDNTLQQCQDFYASNNLPYVIFMPQDLCQQEASTTLKRLGYVTTGKSIAMALELGASYDVHSDDECSIKQTDKNLKDWVFPLKDAFESTDEICLEYANAHERALEKKFNMHHFSIYCEEKPVASLTLAVHNGIARIDDLGTQTEFRGRGYATNLLKNALGQAIKLGATQCFMDASLAGISIYRKLGFKVLFKNMIYEQKSMMDKPDARKS